MKTSRLALACGLALALLSPAVSATERFVSPSGGHVPPFINWADAATNIQDAIDTASAGDVVWVTNGVYSSGGKVKAGDLTNRVALDKALIVQSVNGSVVTIIQGQFDAVSTNGPGAVRCAWLTNGATLSGFTLRDGATRSSGDAVTLQSGGGAWCTSTNALLINCAVTGNSAAAGGGGAYGCLVKNSVLNGNRSGSAGGGAANCRLNNCAVTGNSTSGLQGGGTSSCGLNNCTLTGNTAGSFGGGSNNDSVTNCIIYFNSTGSFSSSNPNYFSGSFRYTCTSPLPSGTGNTSVPPGLLADGVHLSELSPCRGAGNAASVSGTDIDGQAWANPPSMGCDEWGINPVMYGQPRARPATVSREVRITTLVTGQQPLFCFWSKDGVPLVDGAGYGDANTPSLAVKTFGLEDAGAYQVVVSNAFGMVTSQVSQVAIRCVDAAGTAPSPPFSSWGSAATTIQDAIEAASAGDVILVTNGIYSSGGKAVFSDLTNRVVVDKALLVTSVNGPGATMIQGQRNPVSQIGSGTIRCAWMGEGSGLSGFTLLNGATQSGATAAAGNGGGVLCASTNTHLANCVITNCCSAGQGGGAYLGTLNNCMLVGNSALLGGVGNGGGAHSSVLNNCPIINNTAKTESGGVGFGLIYNSLLAGNSAGNSGGGARGGTLINCTLAGNSAGFRGGGSDIAALTNCIVYFNTAPNFANIAAGSAMYSCSTPLPSGPGNISSDPQLTDGVHLAITSPCRGTGSPLYTSGTDIDGELWSNPPSMGCDEVWESALIGPLSVGLTAGYPEVPTYGVLPLTGQAVGRASRLEWSFGDGPIFTNLSYLTSHIWTNPGDYPVSFTAYNTDNPGGVSTNLLVHVVPLASPQLTVGGLNGTNYSLSFPGQPGVTYVVEQSTNLVPPVTWQTVQTLTSTGALMQVTDTKATNAMRFYRARTQ